MRITVNTVEEFLQALREDSQFVREVWVRADELPASDKNDVDWDIAVWLTCVVERPGLPFILEYGQIVGQNILEGDDKTDAGTVNAGKIIQQVEAACQLIGMKTRKGKVEF